MRPIVGACALSGRYVVSGSSSESPPASRSCMIPTAVKVFVIEPIRYCVCGVASSAASTSASPRACSHTSSSLRKTDALTDGIRSSLWAAASVRSNSSRNSSGADTGSERSWNRLQRRLDLLLRDVEMRDRAQDRRVDRRRERDTLLGQSRHGLLLRERGNVELDEIRLDPVQVDREPRLRETQGEPLRAAVVVGEAVDVVVECIDAGCSDDPGLAHRAAEEMLEPPRVAHHPALPGQNRAQRAAEPFREAQRDSVEARPDLGGLDAERDRRVEEARTVEVEGQAELECDRVQLADLLQGPHPAATRVVRVLDPEDAGAW